jgi:hypothetical protein
MMLELAVPIHRRRNTLGPELSARRLLRLARIAMPVFGWSATVGAWERHFAPADEPHRRAHARPSQLSELAHIVANESAKALLGPECKELSLTLWGLARAEGYPAELIVGVTDIPFRGHMWIECDGRVLAGASEARPYDAVARYAGRGLEKL